MNEVDDLPEEYRLPARLPTVPPGYARPGVPPQGYVPSYGGHRHWQPPPRPALPADTREALPKLWDEAKTVWNAMWLAFGDVAYTIAGDHILPATHKLMGDWVRNAELLVRRIILIASLTLDLAPLKPVKRDASPRSARPAKPRALKPVTPDNPETWRTSFRLFPCAARASRSRRARCATATPRRVTARGYALRIEAMRRVIRDREAYALRTARRFQRLAAANRTANQPRDIGVASWSYHPLDRTPGKHVIEEAMRLAQPLAFRVTDDWNRRYVEPG
jgi:hypothetical protein